MRTELCAEAMRLTRRCLNSLPAATPATHALLALMCLHAARLPSRVDESGNLTLFFEQDRSQWDARLIGEGQRLAGSSATGAEMTEYHVEAAIAATHCCAARAEETDWGRIVWLYDRLMAIRPSPVIALNRAIAIAQDEGPARGLEEIKAIQNSERIATYPFYAAAIGELEFRRGRREVAGKYFRDALALARIRWRKRFLERRVEESESAGRSARQLDRNPFPPVSIFHRSEINGNATFRPKRRASTSCKSNCAEPISGSAKQRLLWKSR